jgi:hypothetical protein
MRKSAFFKNHTSALQAGNQQPVVAAAVLSCSLSVPRSSTEMRTADGQGRSEKVASLRVTALDVHIFFR